MPVWFDNGMPEHEMSVEAAWLTRMYGELADHQGRNFSNSWIAVVGEEIVDSDTDPVALTVRVSESYGEGGALFASVRPGRLG